MKINPFTVCMSVHIKTPEPQILPAYFLVCRTIIGWRCELFKWTRWCQKYANEVEKCQICQFAVTLDSLVRFGWYLFHKYLARSNSNKLILWLYLEYSIFIGYFLFFGHLLTLNDLCKLEIYNKPNIVSFPMVNKHGTLYMEAPFLGCVFYVGDTGVSVVLKSWMVVCCLPGGVFRVFFWLRYIGPWLRFKQFCGFFFSTGKKGKCIMIKYVNQ